jgi:hypothetical protein
MRRLSLIIFLVCLMTSGAFAATTTWVGSAGPTPPAGTGEWSADGNYWSPAGIPTDGLSSDYVKVETTKECTLASNAGNFAYKKLTVAGTTAQLNITSNSCGKIGTGNEFQVGDVDKTGRVVQTGGIVSTFYGKTAGKIEIGYKQNSVGYYTISGGSIGFGSTTNDGQIIVGGAGTPGSTGTFTIIGNAATIDTNNFLVGVKDSSGGYPGTGTVEFRVGLSPINTVSPIKVRSSVIIDPCDGLTLNATANLIVTLLDEDVPCSVIPLIITGSGVAVLGVFDQVNWGGNGSGDEGDAVTLTTPLGVEYTRYLTYLYNAEAHTFGNGNDIALIIPEPATIALLGLGSLIAIRRKRK